MQNGSFLSLQGKGDRGDEQASQQNATFRTLQITPFVTLQHV